MNDEIYFDGVRYISAGEAASLVGFTRGYVARLCNDGKLIAKKLGVEWYVSLDSVKKFAHDQEYGRYKRNKEVLQGRRQQYSTPVTPVVLPLAAAAPVIQPNAVHELLTQISAPPVKPPVETIVTPLLHKDVYASATPPKEEKKEIVRQHMPAPAPIPAPAPVAVPASAKIQAPEVIQKKVVVPQSPPPIEKKILPVAPPEPRILQEAVVLKKSEPEVTQTRAAPSIPDIPVKNVVKSTTPKHKTPQIQSAFQNLVASARRRMPIHKFAAVGVAAIFLASTAVFVGAQYARITHGPGIQNGQLAAAAVNAGGNAFEDFAKAFNDGVNSIFYSIMFPRKLVESSSAKVVARVTPTPLATSTSNTYITQPARTEPVERVIERIVDTDYLLSTAGGITEEILDARLEELHDTLVARILFDRQTDATHDSIDNVYDSFAGSLTTQELTVSTSATIASLTLSSPLSISSGGTGTSSAPSYGQVLLGNAAGTYDLVATSSLGISGGGGSIDGSGSANLFAYWSDSDTLAATSSPTVGYLTATSTTATSTFGAGIQTTYLNITGTAATSTFANGIRLTGGCFLMADGTCAGAGGGGGVSLSAANTWTALQLFAAGASSTQFSALDAIYVGRTSTTTIRGDNVASNLPYASSTAISVSGTGYFGTASTTNLTISSLPSSLLSTNGSGAVQAAGVGNGLTFSGNTLSTSFGTTTANTWTALQQFSNASSSLFSANKAWFGGTATSTFTSAGYLGIGTSTPNWSLQVASTTPYVAITDTDAGSDVKHWILSNIDGVFRMGYAQDALTSTTTEFLLDGALDNIAIGDNNLSVNTTGNGNISLGQSTLASLTTGFENTAIGHSALNANITGNENVAIGDSSLENTINGSSVALGYSAGRNLTTGGGSIAIGYGALLPSATANNQLSIGNLIFGTLPATSTNSAIAAAPNLPTTGKIGIASTSPFAKLSVHANNGSTDTTLFAVGSSTVSATTTLFSISNTGILTSNASATSTFSGALASAYLNITGTAATSTFANGVNLGGGCFAINGTCLAAASIDGSGGANRIAYWSDGDTLTSSATFTFNGTNLGVGTSTPYAKLTVWGGGTGTGNLFELVNNASTTVAKFLDNGTGYFLGNIGIGTTSPYRKLSVTDAVTTAQAVLAYDGTRYTEFLTDSVGDLVINPQGDDAFLNDDNLLVCTGGSCPSGNPTGTGNIVSENKLGVGTTTPAYKLTIETQDAVTNFLQIASSTAQSLFVVNANGNVGIATSSPWAKLAIGPRGSIVTTENALSDGATIAINWLDGNQQRVTLGGNRTVTFSNYTDGQVLRLVLCQDGTGSRTATWPTAVLWQDGSAPTLTTTANKCDLVSFVATQATSTLKVFGAAALNF